VTNSKKGVDGLRKKKKALQVDVPEGGNGVDSRRASRGGDTNKGLSVQEAKGFLPLSQRGLRHEPDVTKPVDMSETGLLEWGWKKQ